MVLQNFSIICQKLKAYTIATERSKYTASIYREIKLWAVTETRTQSSVGK